MYRGYALLQAHIKEVPVNHEQTTSVDYVCKEI